MNRFALRALSVAAITSTGWFAPPVSAQVREPAQSVPQTRQVQGQIVQTGTGQFIVRTTDNKQYTVRVNPQTRFMLNEKPIQFTDLKTGANVNIALVGEGDLQVAQIVTLAPGVAVVPAEGTQIEGSIVRVVGNDQVVVRTADGKEVVVFVNPQTSYLLEDRAGVFTDLRQGADVRIRANVNDGRHTAREFVVPSRKK